MTKKIEKYGKKYLKCIKNVHNSEITLGNFRKNMILWILTQTSIVFYSNCDIIVKTYWIFRIVFVKHKKIELTIKHVEQSQTVWLKSRTNSDSVWLFSCWTFCLTKQTCRFEIDINEDFDDDLLQDDIKQLGFDWFHNFLNINK